MNDAKRDQPVTDLSVSDSATLAGSAAAGASFSSTDLATTPALPFDQFFAERREVIGRTLSMTLGDEQLGFEAADEAMARAYERWSSVSTYGNPEGWVYRTGLNWARSWLRRRKRGRPKDELVASSEAVHDSPPDLDLASALRLLNDDQRAVVVLRFYRDWSVEQTATALGIAPGTVKSRLSRAMQELHRQLDPPDPTVASTS